MAISSIVDSSGSVAVSVSGSGLGAAAYTHGVRVGGSACEASEWGADSSAVCALASGAAGTRRAVVSLAAQSGTASALMSYDAAELSSSVPVNTPTTKEGYLYRSIFEEHYPQPSAVATCKGGPSVACSTAKAIEWDAAFKAMAESTGGECSGRAVAGVHNAAYKAGEGARDDRKAGQKGAGEPAAKRLRAE